MAVTCENCKTREASANWGGENYCGLCNARNPRDYPQWCGHCIAEAQLAYAQKIAAQIPEITARLQENP